MVRVGLALVLSPVFLALFWWLQMTSKYSGFFLWYFSLSFVFLALAVFLLVSVRVESASRRAARLFYAVALVAVLLNVGVAYSIATVPPGGTRRFFRVEAKTVHVDLTYGWTVSGKLGYRGGWSETVYEADYPVGAVFLFYNIYGLRIVTNRSVVANVTVSFYLTFEPNRVYYRAFERSVTGTALQNGTEVIVGFSDHLSAVYWGHDAPGLRARLDRGYSVSIGVGLEYECSDYGSLKATIPFDQDVFGDDVEVSSQLQDGIGILLSGVFLAVLLSIPARQLKPKVERRLAPFLKRVESALGAEQTPKGFLKKCVECGKEIPIASEQCQYCGAKQPQAAVRAVFPWVSIFLLCASPIFCMCLPC